MSSHYIVRDEQEPALILSDLTEVGFSTIGPLLEWSPTIIILEPAVEKVLSWGIKMDVVICTEENKPTIKQKLEDQIPLKLIICASQQEFINTAFGFLLGNNHKAVNLIDKTSSGLLKLLTEYCDSIETVIVDQKGRTHFVDGEFRKWMPKDLF